MVGPESKVHTADRGTTLTSAPAPNGLGEGKDMEQRIAVIGVVLEHREHTAQQVNEILSDYGHLVVGRMGIPYRERDLSVISLIVDGSTDDIGAMTGKLGNLPGVRVRSAFTL